MKFTKSQIVNLILFMIIILLLAYILDKETLSKWIPINKIQELMEKSLNRKILLGLADNNNTITICDNNSDSESVVSYVDSVHNGKSIAKQTNNKNSESATLYESDSEQPNKNNLLSASQYYSENLDDKYSEKIYDYLQKIVVKPRIKKNEVSNLNKKKFKSQKLKMPESKIKTIQDFLKKEFNKNKNIKFNELEIPKNIFCTKNENMIEMQPIQVKSECKLLSKNNNSIERQLKLQIELIFEFDDTDTVFIQGTKFLGKFGIFKIVRISLINSVKINEPMDSTLVNLNNIDTHLISESDDEPEIDGISIPNEHESNDDLPIYSYKDFDKSNFFEGNHASETLNSIIPDRIEITENDSNDASILINSH